MNIHYNDGQQCHELIIVIIYISKEIEIFLETASPYIFISLFNPFCTSLFIHLSTIRTQYVYIYIYIDIK